ncbi:hypothetical protein AX774_g6329 [Zancudomyces culisetae]|uniref:Uncharacterized protein n=1 Tax=Zancudomyces culisetae TaxID=1213189 RepID=A0A1R1PH25_ZANCU|nr:hypothetical protein AX774_g6329 [Zancudomyces culisetae]|eukprot:OMH80248.1 hypothetical protein AX774_g6329 [Zancudomyces culisetae]
MKAKTFQINWHEKLPIFSVDFDPNYESSASKTTEAIGNPQQYTPQQNENGINKDIDKLNASVNASGIIDSNTNDFLYRFATGGGDYGSIVLWKQWDSNKTNENSTVGSYTAGTANILGEPGMVADPPRDGSGNDSKNSANSSTTSVLEANDGGILYDDITGIQGPEVWKPITILR